MNLSLEPILRAIFSKLVILFTVLNIFSSLLRAEEFSLHKGIGLISADSLKKHVEFLGHDSLQGRGTGTRGEKVAAQYIANYLKMLQLKPLGDDGTYLQAIPMHGSFPLPESELTFFSGNEEHKFELGKDYLLYKSGAQTFIPQPVPLVFVGYGIIAPEFDYNDYQAMDVEGKVVVYLSGEPPSNDSSYFNGNDPTIYFYPESKQRIAISRGALGSILIPSIKQQDFDWQRTKREFAFEDITLAYSVTGNLSVLMNPNAATKLFDGVPFNLYQIFEMDRTHTIRSFPLNNRISFKGAFLERDFFASNVIGMYAGLKRKPNDSYIIVSSHFDHLGIGSPVDGDSIYNGVVDNAVGVAAVLEIARVFSTSPKKPFHSILFLFVTGEEKGLLGSTYYLDHPIVPLYKTIANVNVDGLAVFDLFNDVVGIGAELSTLGEHLKIIVNELGINLSPIPPQFLGKESFARSDQIAFAKAGIPSILISEGLNYKNMSKEKALRKITNWYEQIYHSPFDDLNQPMNFQAAHQHCQILFAFCYSLANSTSLPQWSPGTPYINERLRTIAERR